MKKFAFLMLLLLCVSFAGCGDDKDGNVDGDEDRAPWLVPSSTAR